VFSLFAGCGSGRNQPNDFLTLLVGKPRVNDKKNRAGANLPNGDVPILFLIMGSVPNRYGVWVVKDKRSVSKSTSCLARFFWSFCSSYSNRMI
jgi:hypothetical protein